MSSDPNKKTARTFQCRDILWDAFQQMAHELECSVDYLINESMKQYARQRYAGAEGTRRNDGLRRHRVPAASSRAPQPAAPAMRASALPPPPGGACRFRRLLRARGRPSLPPPPPPGATRPRALLRRPPGLRAAGAAAASSALRRCVPAHSRSVPPPLPARRAAPPPPSGRRAAALPSRLRRATPVSSVVVYAGERLAVNKDRFIIGRGKQSSDLTIKDPNVSRQHAMVEFLNGQYYMVDMGSTNGVEYNGQRISRKADRRGRHLPDLRSRGPLHVPLTARRCRGVSRPSPRSPRQRPRRFLGGRLGRASLGLCRRGGRRTIFRCPRARAASGASRRAAPLSASAARQCVAPRHRAFGVRLPLFVCQAGPGLRRAWVERRRPRPWVCQDALSFVRRRPIGFEAAPSIKHAPSGLPFRLLLRRSPRAPTATAVSRTPKTSLPICELEPGFAVAIVDERMLDKEPPLWSHPHGLWVPMRDLGAVAPSPSRAKRSPNGASISLWVIEESRRCSPLPGLRRERGKPARNFA